MNIKTLSNFLRVAEIGTLKGAAVAVNIAQPALTRQITLLEQSFGAQLFTRHRRGMALTDAGEQLRSHAERIISEMEQAHDAVSAIAQEPTGTISLGLPTSMLYVLSAHVVSAYVKTYPNVFLKVHEAIGHVVEELLRARRVDIAILIASARNLDNVEMTPLLNENVYLAGPPDAGLDQDVPVPVTYLAEVPMIMLAPQNHLRLHIEKELAAHDLQFRRTLEVEGQPLVLDLMKQGVGYTVLPHCAVQAEMAVGNISAAPINGVTITWTLAVNRARAQSPAIRALVQFIREALDERIASGDWQASAVNGTK